ncbi:MAG: hypothetical protein WKF30_15040 [Pyrinomonadaceae bacterium]
MSVSEDTQMIAIRRQLRGQLLVIVNPDDSLNFRINEAEIIRAGSQLVFISGDSHDSREK